MIDPILRLAKKLISYQSEPYNEEGCLQILDEVKKLLGEYTSTNFLSKGSHSCLFTNQEEEKNNFKIILNAHLDIVPATQEQFLPFEENGKLYGRGAADMKTAAAAMILVFKDIAKKVSYPLALQLTTDEEAGGFNGTQYQIEKGVRGDFVIIGEPTNMDIVHQAKGRMIIKVITHGKTAHGAYPWLGDNAILRMYEVIANFASKYPSPNEETDRTTVSVSRIQAENKSYNKIPNACEAYFDVRYDPEEKGTIVHTLTNLLPKNAKLEVVFINAPHDTSEHNPYVKRLKSILEQDFPRGGALKRTHGTSDLPFYMEVGCDGIEFGLSGQGHHGEHEYVEIETIESYYTILKKFLLSIDTTTI